MTDTTEFSIEEKLSEVKREVAMRRAVYGGKVRAGQMTAQEAHRRTAIMEAIRADYERALGQGKLAL